MERKTIYSTNPVAGFMEERDPKTGARVIDPKEAKRREALKNALLLGKGQVVDAIEDELDGMTIPEMITMYPDEQDEIYHALHLILLKTLNLAVEATVNESMKNRQDVFDEAMEKVERILRQVGYVSIFGKRKIVAAMQQGGFLEVLKLQDQLPEEKRSLLPEHRKILFDLVKTAREVEMELGADAKDEDQVQVADFLKTIKTAKGIPSVVKKVAEGTLRAGEK